MKEEPDKEGSDKCFVSNPEIVATFALPNGQVNELLSLLHKHLMRVVSKAVERELKVFGMSICIEACEMEADLSKAQGMADAMAVDAKKAEVNKLKAMMAKWR